MEIFVEFSTFKETYNRLEDDTNSNLHKRRKLL